jgi:phasin protein
VHRQRPQRAPAGLRRLKSKCSAYDRKLTQIKEFHAALSVVSLPTYAGNQQREDAVAQTDRSTKSTASNLLFAELGEMGKKRTEAMAAAQTELLDEFQEIGQRWVARAKSEADAASQLVAKLTSARSVPETATAYQEWASRRMQLAIEDSQRLFTDGLKLMETSARFFSNGSVNRRA